MYPFNCHSRKKFVKIDKYYFIKFIEKNYQKISDLLIMQ